MNTFIKKWPWFLIIFGMFLVIFSLVTNNREPSTGSNISNFVSNLVFPSSTVTPASFQNQTKTPVPTKSSSGIQLPTAVPRSDLTGPATCQISGAINFLEENLYENKNAKIFYQNVDDGSRFINWTVSPNDNNLRVGPNIFAQLVLPNGESLIGVSIGEKSSVKKYILTANVTYGILGTTGELILKEANCTGSIEVNLP